MEERIASLGEDGGGGGTEGGAPGGGRAGKAIGWKGSAHTWPAGGLSGLFLHRQGLGLRPGSGPADRREHSELPALGVG